MTGTDMTVLLAILLMGITTFAAKAMGLQMVAGHRIPRFLGAMMRHAPAAVILAIVAPLLVTGGALLTAGAGATIVVALRTKNFLLAVAAGVATVGILEAVGLVGSGGLG